MIGIVSEVEATNGTRLQILSVSTVAAKDNTKAGRSQATLMFSFTPSNDTEKFRRYWLPLLGMGSDVKSTSLGLNDLESYYLYDKQSQMHREVAFVPSPQGSYLVAYLGMDRAYQANKQHFLDFLSQIKVGCAATD